MQSCSLHEEKKTYSVDDSDVRNSIKEIADIPSSPFNMQT